MELSSKQADQPSNASGKPRKRLESDGHFKFKRNKTQPAPTVAPTDTTGPIAVDVPALRPEHSAKTGGVQPTAIPVPGVQPLCEIESLPNGTMLKPIIPRPTPTLDGVPQDWLFALLEVSHASLIAR